VDNAAAVTTSGQHIIKTTAKFINGEYRKLLHTTDDYCVYIDTDSNYFSSLPLLPKDTDTKQFTIELAREMETKCNKFYDVMAKRLFNCDSHRFFIKGESVMFSAFWVAKKMYAMKKVYDLETNHDTDKIVHKGLAVVRSQTPPAFKTLMMQMLEDILNLKEKDVLDQDILTFRNKLTEFPVIDLARSSAVKELSKFIIKGSKSMTVFMKGSPAHVKAAIAYNNFLIDIRKNEIHNPFRDGDKIKFVPLLENPKHIARLAFKNYDDPPEILEYIEEYIDYEATFDSEVSKKIQTFYDALGWGLIPTEINQDAALFFDFN